MTFPTPPRDRNDVGIAIICALPVEAESVRAVFDKCWEDEGHQYGKAARDRNTYTTGAIGRHNVVLLRLPSMGSVPAAQAAADLSSSFPSIGLVLVTGVCGVVPTHPDTKEEIMLGDVVISTELRQYDFGRLYPGGFQRKVAIEDNLRKAPREIRGFMNKLITHTYREKLIANLAKAMSSKEFQTDKSLLSHPGPTNDCLYEASYAHRHQKPVKCDECHDGREPACPLDCTQLGCDKERLIARSRSHSLQNPPAQNSDLHQNNGPFVHFGRFGSANTVMKSGLDRDNLATTERLIAFEMEGAGVWDEYATIVVKGACDYADSHKNKVWQPYAAMVAAITLKMILAEWVVTDRPAEARRLGLCLASAPLISADQFVGRATEIAAIHNLLRPDDTHAQQRRVVLGGMGGVGKTQLAIAYARRYDSSYTSVLWLNATSETTLYASFRSVAPTLTTADMVLDNEKMLSRVHNWLSEPRNTQWLLIFDNHDDPDHFDLNTFCPNIGHGSIIITTRLPDMVTGEQVRVRLLDGLDDSLQILQTRSQRDNVANDTGARCLAARLAGLPLALVTAGAYLRKRTITFQQYLDIYERHWQIDSRRPPQLHEYRDRTLYTTWDLTFNRLETNDPEAAQMLRLLAYFDNQEINYKLLHAGLSDRSPEWLQSFVLEQVDFENLMGMLVEYGLVDAHYSTQSYSMHNCVHDWTLRRLSQKTSPQLYGYAFDCVAASLDENDWHSFGEDRYAWICRHAVRLIHPYFSSCIQDDSSSLEQLKKAVLITRLLIYQAQFPAAEQLCKLTLAKCEGILGYSHEYTLDAVHYLGLVYAKQDKLDEAEQMYTHALDIKEKALGLDHVSTLKTVYNLGLLYQEQNRHDEAEQMYMRALAGYEKAFGPDHILKLMVYNNLALLYQTQSKLDEAERMYTLVLAGYEKMLGPNHVFTLNTLYNLAHLFPARKKTDEAEEMFIQALESCKEALGPNHFLTINLHGSLGYLYREQGKLEKAPKMYISALAGLEKLPRPDHVFRLKIISNLAGLHLQQKNLDEAQRMFSQVLAGYEELHGPDHFSTLVSAFNLGITHYQQGKLYDAEQFCTRGLNGFKRIQGSDHISTLDATHGVAVIYKRRKKVDKAKQMHEEALAGYVRVFGPDHPRTLGVMEELSKLNGLQYGDKWGALQYGGDTCGKTWR